MGTRGSANHLWVKEREFRGSVSGLEGKWKGDLWVLHKSHGEGRAVLCNKPFSRTQQGEGEGFLNLHSFQEHRAWVTFNMVKHMSVDLLPCVKPRATVVKRWPSCKGLTFLGGTWAKTKPHTEKSMTDYARSSKNQNQVMSVNKNYPNFIKVTGWYAVCLPASHWGLVSKFTQEQSDSLRKKFSKCSLGTLGVPETFAWGLWGQNYFYRDADIIFLLCFVLSWRTII